MGKSFGKNNKNWYLEAPNQLYSYQVFTDEDRNTFESDGYTIIGDMAYTIESWQVAPFLPDTIEDIVFISERECIEWMLNHD